MLTSPRVQSIRLALLTAAWSVSLLLMGYGSFTDAHWWRWLAWGIYLCAVGCLLSAWWIIEAYCRHSRLRVEELAKIMAGVAAQDGQAGPDGVVTPLR